MKLLDDVADDHDDSAFRQRQSRGAEREVSIASSVMHYTIHGNGVVPRELPQEPLCPEIRVVEELEG